MFARKEEDIATNERIINTENGTVQVYFGSHLLKRKPTASESEPANIPLLQNEPEDRTQIFLVL